MSNRKVLSRSEIEHKISQGDAIVIYDSTVLRLNAWIKYHPGGDKAVYHLIGRDATDEMVAYHSDATVESFKRWQIGVIDHKWENFRPPIQGGHFRSFQEQANEDSKVESFDEESTESSEAEEDFSVNKKVPIGFINETVKPVIPGNMIPSLSTKEAYERKVVKDPSDVIDNYDKTLLEMDLKALPALDPVTQESLSVEYNKLHQQVIDGGFYQCDYWAYGRESLRIGTLFSTSFILLYFRWYFLSAVAIGFAWQQLVFIAHDSGHISITHNYQFDNIIGMVVASYIGGLSLGWWKRNHNVHHLITNDPVHDPDIQHLPFFAVSTRLFGNVYSTYYEKFLWFDKFAQMLIPFQSYLYYPILCFGRFNLYRLSWQHILFGLGPRHGKAAWFRYFELVGLAFFNYWFFYLIIYKTIPENSTRFMYVMVSHITTMIVHVQITLSHFAMSTQDLGVHESFVSRQMRTTMDVDCPEWFDYFHGGLQFQAIHHLFPRLPRHNFRKVQPMVIGFCDKVGLKYSIYGFVDGNEEVINKLGEIAKQARVLKECTKSMKEEAVREGNYFEPSF